MILCCGEALIDMIPVEVPTRGTAYAPHPGGAVFNTAIALGRLGVSTGMVSGVSTDAFGTLLTDALRDNGVETSLLVRSDRLTTLAIVHLETGSATYSFYDENSAGRAVTRDDMPTVPAEVTALFFGGISLVSDPAATAYAALLNSAHADRLVMIDPNIRPAFITDEAAYRDRLGRMVAQSDIVKVSDEDLAWLFPQSDGMEAKVDALRACGPRLAIVTQGAQGVTAYFNDSRLTVPAEAASVVDTVGAGDTFNAGFLAGLRDQGGLTKPGLAGLSEAAVREALSLGVKAAAYAVSKAGANPPWAHDLGR